MSQRERDARAAMRSIIRVTCASQWHQEAGRLDYSMPSGEHIAKLANEVADAMDTERRKREAAEAPAPEHHACHAEIAAAMREGRDAGLIEAVQVVARRRFHSDFPRDERTLQDAWEAISALRAKDAPAAPDIASLQAELAKLRAVAEAAAAVQRGRHQDGLNDGPITARLTDALDAALPSWRTK